MSLELLDKTRKLNNVLHNFTERKIAFDDICTVLSESVTSNVMIMSRKGKILGKQECEGIDQIGEMASLGVSDIVATVLNERMLNVLSTKENADVRMLGFVEKGVEKYFSIVVPIIVRGGRLGTLFMYREDKPYDIEDIIISEHGAIVVGLEMMRSEQEESDEESRRKRLARSALSTLSFSEYEAIQHVFNELDSHEGLVVASRVADRVGITRSVIVNALKKFESAGVIEARSSGMKGTYIRVVNDAIFEELEARKDIKKNFS